MQFNQDRLQELAERIYDLDAEVYAQLGSSLGRVFNRDREGCVSDLVKLMNSRDRAHLVRSELALISNMARTIPNREIRAMVMKEYNDILHQVRALPTSFGGIDILNPELASLNALNLKQRFGAQDHLVICIGRTYGSGGNDIGFALADALKINYYDAEIFSEVLKRLDAEKDLVLDRASFTDHSNMERAFAENSHMSMKERMRAFSRYHGLSKRDAVFFNQSDLICDMAKKESFIVMGRCADVILTNNRVPHISIFITAPFEQRLRRAMEINKALTAKQAAHLLKRLDRQHTRYYQFYTGRKWGDSVNYDLCLNSAAYGIDGSVDFILRMLEQDAS